MDCIKAFIILSVVVFHLPVMPRSKGIDGFVADSMHFHSGVSGKEVGKFSPIVCLNTLDCTWECLHQMIHKLSGRNRIITKELTVPAY